jgi:hypothetical protein
MLSAQVILLLKRAGVTEIDRLSPVLTALRRYLDPIDEPESHQLTDDEKRFLSAVVPFSLEQSSGEVQDQMIANTIIAYMDVVNRSVSEESLAELMGLDALAVRRLYDDRKLFGIAGPNGLVFPKFQFIECGSRMRIIPGFDAVLSAMPSAVHPLAFERFFMNPCPDLEVVNGSEPLTPREWLIDGRDPEPICQIVREL